MLCIAWADYGSNVALDNDLPLHALRVTLGESPGYVSLPCLFTESQGRYLQEGEHGFWDKMVLPDLPTITPSQPWVPNAPIFSKLLTWLETAVLSSVGAA